VFFHFSHLICLTVGFGIVEIGGKKFAIFRKICAPWSRKSRKSRVWSNKIFQIERISEIFR
jgi:hypothetical protein